MFLIILRGWDASGLVGSSVENWSASGETSYVGGVDSWGPISRGASWY